MRCCERLEAGSLDQLEHRTAGNIADTLCHLARELPPSEDQLELEAAAAEFRAFVGTRNNLVHSKPGLAHDGRPRLFRHGDAWTLEELEGVAAAFARCAERLERVLATCLR